MENGENSNVLSIYPPGQHQQHLNILPENFFNFQDGINWVADKMEIDIIDVDWIVDAELICHTITEIMTEKDPIYRYVFENLLATATFYRGSKIDIPLDFDQYLRFKLPFPITPIFDMLRPVYIRLYTPVNHPMISNNYISPEKLQLLLRSNLQESFNRLHIIHSQVSSIEYKLTYRAQEIGDQGLVHEILACEQRDFGTPCVISFVFLPALEFGLQEYPLPSFVPVSPTWSHCSDAYYWLALLQVYPPMDNRTFCPYVPHMQFVQDERMLKYRNVLRLLTKIGIGNIIEDISDIFVLKGLHFYRLRYNNECDCNRSMATLFIEMLNIHTDIVYRNALQRFITFGGYQQHWMFNAAKLDNIARNLSLFYYRNMIHTETLKQLFGIV